MCDEALAKFHNRHDRATLFIFILRTPLLLHPNRTLPTGALEVILALATSFSSRHELDLTCFAFYRPFSVPALVHLPNEEIIRTAVIYGLLASGGGSALATGPMGTKIYPVIVEFCSRASRGRPRNYVTTSRGTC